MIADADVPVSLLLGALAALSTVIGVLYTELRAAKVRTEAEVARWQAMYESEHRNLRRSMREHQQDLEHILRALPQLRQRYSMRPPTMTTTTDPPGSY